LAKEERKKGDSLHTCLKTLIGKSKGKVHPRAGQKGSRGIALLFH
jgi:hypothetical protein